MAANVARAAAAAHQTEACGLLVAHWAGSPALAHLTAALPGWILAVGLAWNPAGCQHNKVNEKKTFYTRFKVPNRSRKQCC
jgi:hypothetical protein